MSNQKKRAYVSEVRQRQADETRCRITAAGRKLLEQKGYAGMTIEAVAKEAGVAVPTVYSVCKSKTGIFAEILDASRFGESYNEALNKVMQATDPRERLKLAAGIARSVYESEDAVWNLMRGAEAVAPELAQHDVNLGCHRYEVQEHLITGLANAGYLRTELSTTQARDILWCLTSRDLYRLFIRGRGWSAKEYEDWLAHTLIEMLVSKKQSSK